MLLVAYPGTSTPSLRSWLRYGSYGSCSDPFPLLPLCRRRSVCFSPFLSACFVCFAIQFSRNKGRNFIRSSNRPDCDVFSVDSGYPFCLAFSTATNMILPHPRLVWQHGMLSCFASATALLFLALLWCFGALVLWCFVALLLWWSQAGSNR